MAETRLAAGDKLDDPEAREAPARPGPGLPGPRLSGRPSASIASTRAWLQPPFRPDYPNDNDAELRVRAVAIAPQVASIGRWPPRALLEHGLVDEAERVIQPIANDPHGDEISPRVRRILDRIAAARVAAPPAPGA